jgi:hypothetical protein
MSDHRAKAALYDPLADAAKALANGRRVELVGDLWRILRRAAQEHVDGLEKVEADYLGDRSKLHTITRDNLLVRLRDGDVVVLDVRP